LFSWPINFGAFSILRKLAGIAVTNIASCFSQFAISANWNSFISIGRVNLHSVHRQAVNWDNFLKKIGISFGLA